MQYMTPRGLQRGGFRAMGTTVSYLLPAAGAEEGGRLVQGLFATWEACLSRFRQESELSRLNRSAGSGRAVVVSELLYYVLTRALEAAEASAGLFDPTLLEQLQQLGYDRTFEEVAREGVALAAETMPGGAPGGGWRRILVDPVQRRVTLPAGVALDFGGIAKGMAVDAALALLRRNGLTPALVNAGGDLAVAGLPPEYDAWPISVPGRQHGWIIPLRRGAMATSGIARRQWRRGDQLLHHLLDPRTGRPVQNDLWSVTVVADRCDQAEVAAKVAFILGPEEGAAFLQRHRIGALFVHADGQQHSVSPWPAQLMRAWRGLLSYE